MESSESTLILDNNKKQKTDTSQPHFCIGLYLGYFEKRDKNKKLKQSLKKLKYKPPPLHYTQSAELKQLLEKIKEPNVFTYKNTLLFPCKYSYLEPDLANGPPTFSHRKTILKKYTTLRDRFLIESYEERQFRELVQIDSLLPFYSEEVRYLTKYIRDEQRTRFQMRRILINWLFKKYNSRYFNKEDPITLSEPESPVFLFNSKQRGSYRFELSSISQHITTSFIHHEYMFPIPQLPKNPLTNLEFTYGELIQLLKNIRKAGLSSWAIEGFIRCKYNLKQFKYKFYSVIKHEALSEYLVSVSDDAIDHFMEFVEFAYDAYDMYIPSINALLRWSARNIPNDPYIRKWKECYRQYYEINITYPALTFDDDRYASVYTTIGRLIIQKMDLSRLTLLRLMDNN